MGGRGDVEIVEFHAVFARDGDGLGGEAGLVKHPIEDVAGPVAGEHAAGAVGAVGSGSEAENQHAGARVAEGWHGAAPIDLVAVGPPLEFRDFRSMGAQARAAPALDDFLLEYL